MEVGSRHLHTRKLAKPPSGGSKEASRQNALDGLQGGFGRPHLAASAHRPSLVHCLVGPDVGVSVLGLRWSVWSVKWASFACVTQDAIFCDFVCIFFVFSSYSGLVLLKT